MQEHEGRAGSDMRLGTVTRQMDLVFEAMAAGVQDIHRSGSGNWTAAMLTRRSGDGLDAQVAPQRVWIALQICGTALHRDAPFYQNDVPVGH